MKKMKFMKIVTCLLFSLIVILSIESGGAQGNSLHLTTDPEHPLEGSGIYRYVIVKKNDQVTFTAAPAPGLDKLSWVFENADSGEGQGNTPTPQTYGAEAEGKRNAVKFSSSRKTTSSVDQRTLTCATTKVTANVIMPCIRRSGGTSGSPSFQIIQDATKKVLVGEQINLDVFVPGLTPSEWKWKIPGKTFKKWQASATKAELVTLEAEDLNKKTVTFLWADGGDDREIECKVKINGKEYTVTGKLDVKRPSGTVTTVTKPVGVFNDSGTLKLAFGSNSFSNPGITFTNNVTTPSGFAPGTFAWTQIAISLHTTARKTDNSLWGADSSGVDEGPVNPMATYTDSPALPLAQFNYAQIADSFETFLMFKPDTVNSQWVPIKKVSWWWNGTATKDSSGWHASGCDSAQNPSGVDETNHPVWTKRVSTSLHPL